MVLKVVINGNNVKGNFSISLRGKNDFLELWDGQFDIVGGNYGVREGSFWSRFVGRFFNFWLIGRGWNEDEKCDAVRKRC